MVDIIDLNILKNATPGDWFSKGKAALDKLSKEDSDVIVDFIRKYSLYEVRINLGLEDVPTDILKHDDYFRFAEMIDDLYVEKSEGCYFCDRNIDPNTIPYSPSVHVCLNCYLKVDSLLKFYGIKEKRPIQ